MKMPRLLPLVAVAAGGVLAINLVENGPGIVGAARSFAEGAARPAASAKADSALPAPSNSAPADQAVAAKPAPICAESPTELAKAAGLSPAELQVIQSLGARRGELDSREQGLSTELALIQAAEAKVDARIATMNGLKTDMQGLLGQLDQKQEAEVDRLVKVFENMKPQLAAPRFVLLTDDVRLPIAAKMKERKLSDMLAQMQPADAKKLTESLAARYLAQANAARQAINPTQAAAAPAPKPAATPPAQASQTTSPAEASTVPAKPAPKPVVHRKPKKATPPARKVAQASTPEPVWPLSKGAANPAKPASAATSTPAKPAEPAAKPVTPPPAKAG